MTAKFGDTPPKRLQLEYGHSLSWLERSKMEGLEQPIYKRYELKLHYRRR